MADESETSATASSGGNSWWNAAVSAGGTSLSQWSNISMLLPVTQSQQPSPCSSALTDLQTLNWSSDIPNSGRAGDQDVDNLSSSITNNTSSTLTMDSSNLSHQDLVDSGSLLDSSVQMANFGTAVSDSQLWNQVLLGTSGSSSEAIQSSMQNTPVGNLREVFYSRALRQELVEPSDHLKKIEDVQPLPGWEFRNLISFQPEDMNLSNIGKQISPLLYNSQLVDHDRLHTSNNALPDLGSWSVAPPDQQPGHHGLVAGRTICLNTFSSGLDAHIPQFDLGRIKQEYPMPYTNALGISPTNSSTLLQGFGAELNYKNEGFPHMLAESGNSKAFLKSNMAAGGCHITGDDQFSGRWPSSNSCSSGQLPVALSHVLPSSPSKQTTSNLTFGNSMNKQILDFSSCKPEKRQHTTDRSLQYFTVQHLEGKPVHNTAHHRTMPHGDEARDTSTDTKRSSTENCTADTIFKRPRFETSSTLPTFKVRKEKLGDRITALQQLVSPFGKTDTASVLLEAIGYIKFLQEQVQVLSTPYMKSGGTSIQGQAQGDQKGWGSSDKKDSDNEPKQDLRSRGLCLVPLSCTLHVANDNGADYWTPSLGGTYR